MRSVPDFFCSAPRTRSWVSYFLVLASAVPIPLLMMTSGNYRRLQVDAGEGGGEPADPEDGRYGVLQEEEEEEEQGAAPLEDRQEEQSVEHA